MAANKSTAVQLIDMLPRLRRYARVLTLQSDAADDLVAGTLSRARHTTRDPAELSSAVSVMAIMHRLHRSQRGRRGRSERALTPAAGDTAPTPGIADLLWQLPVDEREVLMLVVVERLTYDQVATLLDVPAATVIARLTRARAELRERMEALGPSG